MKVHVLCILHPSFVLRGNWQQEPFQVLYLKRARSFVLDPAAAPAITSPDDGPPGCIPFPTLPELAAFIADIGPAGVAVDIEAAGHHITIIGFCRLSDFTSTVARFRKQGGDVYDSSLGDLAQRLRLVWRVLADPDIPKFFHNGQAYDIPQLERAGFVVAGYIHGGGDTMLMQHGAYPEAPKKLGFIANVYAGLPNWKYLSKQDPEGEGK